MIYHWISCLFFFFSGFIFPKYIESEKPEQQESTQEVRAQLLLGW